VKARVFLPSILSGFLLWTAFFPLDLGPVSYFALAPLLTLVRAEGIGRARRYFAALLGGMVFFGLAINWIRVAHPMMALFAWPALAIACALFWPIAIAVLRGLDRFKLPLALTTPVVFVALEYFRSHFPTGYSFLEYVNMHQLVGFGWYHLGYTQHRVEPILQAADLGGVYLLSFGIAAVNGAIAEILVRMRIVRVLLNWPAEQARVGFTRELWGFAGAVAIPLALVAYGTVRLSHEPFETGPRIAAIQGNISQDEKMIKGDPEDPKRPPPLVEEYLHQADLAARTEPKNRPDLIIWPETCFPYDWVEIHPDAANVPESEKKYAETIRKDLGELTRQRFATANLYGLNGVEWNAKGRRKYNSALLVYGDGTIGKRYDKIHLVPFGEYVPLKEQAPWLQAFTPYTSDYSCTPGENWTRFELPASNGKTYTFGMLICYEDSDPYLARQYNPASGKGRDVDFLINISNDGWFDGTEEHEQHLAICRFRAVESRRSVVRAVNMGISAVIDPDGRVVALPVEGDWSKSKKTRGIVRAEVPIDHRETLYARFGDWVPGLCWFLMMSGLIGGYIQKRLHKSPPVTTGGL